MSEWDDTTLAGEPTIVGVSVGRKWEDEEADDVLDSWDAGEDSEEEAAKAEKAAKAAEEAAKLKKTKSERIAEKQAENAVKKQVEEAEKAYQEDETPEERRRRLQQQELENDLKNAQDLFADASVVDDQIVDDQIVDAQPAIDEVKKKAISLPDPKDQSRSINLSALPIFSPTTKKQFAELQEILGPLLTENKAKPHYALFVQDLTRLLVKDMRSEQIRTVASICTTLTNEKLREEKAAEKGGKKTTKGSKKTSLVGTAGKDSDRIDTMTYDDFYEDDFM